MNINEKKKLVIEAGLRLVKTGLIARTWGNISCRIDDSSFLITPSGREYLTLTPEDIVTVRISDCSYSGDVKPSSEKGVHAEVYKLHPHVNFVIHTHQQNASAISALGVPTIKLVKEYKTLSQEVICAEYALPGTKKLRRNVANALKNMRGSALIMKNHGALCFGRNEEDAFIAAGDLENACLEVMKEQYLKLSNSSSFHEEEMNFFALSLFTGVDIKSPKLYNNAYANGIRTEKGFNLLYENGKQTEIILDDISSTLPEEAKIYNSIFKSNENINYIINSKVSEITAVSYFNMKLKPLLDDFAQIAGTNVRTFAKDSKEIPKAFKHSPLVFLQNQGALCCGKTKSEAEAVELVAQKTCKSYVAAGLFQKVKPINLLEGMFMRYYYLNKYSRQAEKAIDKGI